MNRTRGTPSLSAVALPLLLLVVVAGLSQTTQAQHLVSSKAGFVNRVEGKVYIQRQDSEADEQGRASLGTQLRNGDRLRTGVNSYAEVLLSPGSYLRLDEETEIRALNTNIAEPRFELLKGSIILEASDLDKRTPLEIITPHGPVAIAKVGVYRLDARGSMTEVTVRKGELILGTRDQLLARQGTKVGQGKFTQLTGDNATKPEIASLDSSNWDPFDQWSFQRAETLVAANYSLLRRSGYNDVLAFGWMFDPFYNCYTYIPGGRRFNSAYGFSFYSSFGYCSCNMFYYVPYYGSGPYYNGTNVGTLRPSTTPRVAPGGTNDGRTPIHRELPPNRQLDPGVRTSRPTDFSAGRSVDSGSGRSINNGGGMTGNTDSGRSISNGGGVSRGSVGGSTSAPPPPPPPPPPTSSAPPRSEGGSSATRIIR